jgi:hypothetical protein
MLAFRIAAPAALAASLALLGCSLLLTTQEDQCTRDADCQALGSAFAGTVCVDKTCQKPAPPPDPTWGCIGHVAAPEGGAMVSLTVVLDDLITMNPAQGVTASLCSKYDPPCNMPLEKGLAPDAMGRITVTIASDFEGYLQVEGGMYRPTLVFLDQVATPKNEQVLLVSPGAESVLAAQAQVPIDMDAGLVLVRTANCQSEPQAGVSVTISPSDAETRFYVIDNGLSPSATQTDTSGNCGFVNVDPGTPTLTATLGPSGKEMGKLTTLIRGGAVTFQILRPTPTL